MKSSGSEEKKEIIAFAGIVMALSSLICFISHKFNDSNVSILTVFTPSIVAMVLTAMTKGKAGLYDLFIRQTFQKVSFNWFLLSALGIPALASLAVLTSLNFDFSGFGLRTTQLLPQILVIVLIAVGEEYGWRGFLLPKLMKRFNLLHSSLILGLIWGFWHFPAYLIGTGVPLQMNFLVFLLWVVMATFFISWIYCRTQSVLTSILVHISANAAFNYLFVLPEFTGNTKTFWILMGYLSIFMLGVFYLDRRHFTDGSNSSKTHI